MKKYAEIIKKHLLKFYLLNNPYILLRPGTLIHEVAEEYQKQLLINRFLNLTKYLDDCFKYKSELKKAQYLNNFIEVKIWSEILDVIQLRPNEKFN